MATARLSGFTSGLINDIYSLQGLLSDPSLSEEEGGIVVASGPTDSRDGLQKYQVSLVLGNLGPVHTQTLGTAASPDGGRAC